MRNFDETETPQRCHRLVKNKGNTFDESAKSQLRGRQGLANYE